MPAFMRMRSFAMLPLLLTAVLVASLFAMAPSAEAMTRAQRVGVSLDVARAQKGDPYQWGASGPNRFDCSGLVYYAFRKAGLSVPRVASDQAARAKRISRGALKRGDLMFVYSGSSRARNVYHVGIFVGRSGGKALMLHAPRTGTRVRVEPVWTNQWFAGTYR